MSTLQLTADVLVDRMASIQKALEQLGYPEQEKYIGKMYKLNRQIGNREDIERAYNEAEAAYNAATNWMGGQTDVQPK